MGSIDRAGTYLGSVVESTLGQSKNGYPQWIARLLADKKYVTDAEEMKSAGITEPGYVAWPYDDSIVTYMVLFTGDGPVKNYDQVIAATGWTGQSFADLANVVGKRLLFRVEEDTYNNQTSLKVKWVDAEDASPERSLRPAAPDVVKALDQKFLVGMKKPTTPAKPAVAKPSVPWGKPAGGAAVSGATAAPSAASTSQGPTTSPIAPTTPVADPNARASAASSPSPEPAADTAVKSPRKKSTPPPPATANPAPDLPASTTKEAAWEYLNDPAVRGATAENLVAETWVAACNEVGPDRDEGTFTGEDWAKVRNLVLKDLIA